MDTFNSRLDNSLRKRARELGMLTSLLRGELPPELDGHYHVANIRDRTVVIMTDSPVWTTRLRQLGPRILTVLQDSGRKHLLHVRVLCRPTQTTDHARPAPVKKPPKTISQQSGRLIHQAASCIEDDGLRQALLRLVKHTSDDKSPPD